jgi:hypothetical protein
MATEKTTDQSPAPRGSGTNPAGSAATPPGSGAQKTGELADEQLDKVAGGVAGEPGDPGVIVGVVDGVVKRSGVKK